MNNETYPYIKYNVNGVTFLLTPRPDSYDEQAVEGFVQTWRPRVRFQLTDDSVEKYLGHAIPMHWYGWIPGKRIPTELVFNAVSLINYYADRGATIWMHCDSSSMRAPTFFGHYLKTIMSDEQIIALESIAKWTDGRQQSEPSYYSNTSIKMDPGMKELIEAWQTGGEKEAHTYITKVKNEWDKE